MDFFDSKALFVDLYFVDIGETEDRFERSAEEDIPGDEFGHDDSLMRFPFISTLV